MLRGTAVLVRAIAVFCYVTDIGIGRRFVALIIPLGLIMMLAGRFAGRRAVHARRRRGAGWRSLILAVSTSESVRHLVEVTARAPYAGLTIVGCLRRGRGAWQRACPGEFPSWQEVRDAVSVADQLNADVVALAGSGLVPGSIRELGWQLEGSGRNLVMAPEVTEVAGPRLHVSPVEACR